MNSAQKAFVQTVKGHYKKQGRHELPWRLTTDAYSIAVSEIMLQQTQVDRVIPKYTAFLQKFPTVQKLAKAPLSEVLGMWSGLGYNRRAKFLHQMAQAVVNDYKGKFPTQYDDLKKLPGIGPYTAGAISAFAFNQAVPIIETNIRTVYLHHFFKHKSDISDAALHKIIEKTLDTKNPRVWYWALMDYGSHLKSTGIKNNAKSKHYTKQSKFEGSKRQIRGTIMREVLKGPTTAQHMLRIIDRTKEDIQKVFDDLVREGFVKKEKGKYKIL